MMGKVVEQKDVAALKVEEKQIENMILHQDERIMAGLRKGEEIPLALEQEALSLRRVLADIRRWKRNL